jgi:hypothetical protein
MQHPEEHGQTLGGPMVGLRIAFGYGGLLLMGIGTFLSLWLFWQVAGAIQDPPKIRNVVNSFERIVGGAFVKIPELEQETGVPATGTIDTTAATNPVMDSVALENRYQTEQLREILQLLMDSGFHRIIGIMVLFLLLAILVRIGLGLLSTGARLAQVVLWPRSRDNERG